MAINGIGGGANYSIQQQAAQRARGAGAEYDQGAYVRDLNSRLNASVVPGAWDGKSSFGADRATAMIHPEFLKKMHDDPALGAEYEKKINDWAEIDAGIRERMAAQGNTITSLGMSVDKDGKETYHMAGTMTSGGPGGMSEKADAKSDDKKTFKEEMEELLQRLDEKRQKEKLEAKRLAGQETAAVADASYTIDTTA